MESWWARRDSNPQPRDYESPALTVELQALQVEIRFRCRGRMDIPLQRHDAVVTGKQHNVDSVHRRMPKSN